MRDYEITIAQRDSGEWSASLFTLTDEGTQAEMLNHAVGATASLVLAALGKTLDAIPKGSSS